jgi:hypothetical protein
MASLDRRLGYWEKAAKGARLTASTDALRRAIVVQARPR